MMTFTKKSWVSRMISSLNCAEMRQVFTCTMNTTSFTAEKNERSFSCSSITNQKKEMPGTKQAQWYFIMRYRLLCHDSLMTHFMNWRSFDRSVASVDGVARKATGTDISRMSVIRDGSLLNVENNSRNH